MLKILQQMLSLIPSTTTTIEVRILLRCAVDFSESAHRPKYFTVLKIVRIWSKKRMVYEVRTLKLSASKGPTPRSKFTIKM